MSSSRSSKFKGPLKAVILDWAGTTMDYGCYAPAVVFIEVFRRKGVDITMAQAREPMGAHKRVHISKISMIPEVAEKWEAVNGSPCSDANIEEMFQEFIPLQCDCLAEYSNLIPGTLEAVAEFRKRDLKIGSTIGYLLEMMDILLKEAADRGYEPDCSVCASEVPAGRPAPWMCLENAKRLGVFPMEAIVKVGDTLPDIEEGLNAGMWTIGLTKTGNEIGLTEEEINELSEEDFKNRMQRAYDRMSETGAHYIVDTIADVPACLDDINQRLADGNP